MGIQPEIYEYYVVLVSAVSPIATCKNLLSYIQVKKTNAIEEQLQFQLVRIIQKRCNDCYKFTSAYFRRGFFLCHDDPSKTTYRSTLISTLAMNSKQLVDIIQEWVLTSPSITLNELLVRITPNCPTCLVDIDYDECKADHDSGFTERVSQVLSTCAVRCLGQQICTN